MISPERRANLFYDRVKSLAIAMTDVAEVNLESQIFLADLVRHELAMWLDYVRVQTEPSQIQPDIAFPREHVCDSARCCKRVEAR